MGSARGSWPTRPVRLRSALVCLLLLNTAYAQTYVACKATDSELCLLWEVQPEDVEKCREDVRCARECGLAQYPGTAPGLGTAIGTARGTVRARGLVTIESLRDGASRMIFCKRLVLVDGIFSARSMRIRSHGRIRRQIRSGRYRGQTQSQYLALDHGSSKDKGRAEAHSAADSSRASVSGNSGMGQAQSQSIYDPSCDDCYSRSDTGAENVRRPGGSHYGGPNLSSHVSGDPYENTGISRHPESSPGSTYLHGINSQGKPYEIGSNAPNNRYDGGPGYGNGNSNRPNNEHVDAGGGPYSGRGTGPMSTNGNDRAPPSENRQISGNLPNAPGYDSSVYPGQRFVGQTNGRPSNISPGVSTNPDQRSTNTYFPNTITPKPLQNGVQGSLPGQIYDRYNPADIHYTPGKTSIYPYENANFKPGQNINGNYGQGQNSFIPNGNEPGQFNGVSNGQPQNKAHIAGTTYPYVPGQNESNNRLNPIQGSQTGNEPNGGSLPPGQLVDPNGGTNYISGINGPSTNDLLTYDQKNPPSNMYPSRQIGTLSPSQGNHVQWPLPNGPFRGPDGNNYICCVVPGQVSSGSPYGQYVPGGNNNIITGPGLQQNPGTETGRPFMSGGGYIPQGGGTDGQYLQGGGSIPVRGVSGEHYLPGHQIVPGRNAIGGQYIPGKDSLPQTNGPTIRHDIPGIGTQSGMPGQYLPDRVTPEAGVVDGQRIPGTGTEGIRGQYNPGNVNRARPGTEGGYLPGSGTIPEQYAPGSKFIPQTGGSGGQYDPGNVMRPGTEGQYLPRSKVIPDSRAANGQYLPGNYPGNVPGNVMGPRTSETGVHYMPGSGTITGYNPQSGSIPGAGRLGDKFIPGSETNLQTSRNGGPYAPGSGTVIPGTNGNYLPGAGALSQTSGTEVQFTPESGKTPQVGISGGQYLPGTGDRGQGTDTSAQYTPGTGGLREHYMPGTSNTGGSSGQYGPTGVIGHVGENYIPGGPAHGIISEGQYRPQLNNPQGQYIPRDDTGTVIPGSQYDPRNNDRGGETYLPGNDNRLGTMGGNGVVGQNGQYLPGQGGQNSPRNGINTGTSDPGAYNSPGGRIPGTSEGQFIPEAGTGSRINGPGSQLINTGRPGNGDGVGGQLIPQQGPGIVGPGYVPAPGAQHDPRSQTNTHVTGPVQFGQGAEVGPGVGGPRGANSNTFIGSGQNTPTGLYNGGRYPIDQNGVPQNAGDSSNGYNSVPQNYMDPKLVVDDDDSEAEAIVSQAANGTTASASSKGGNDQGRAKTHVQGTYTGTGSFQAQAQISADNKEAESEVSGGKKGASSSATGSGRNNKSQASVQLGSETGAVQTNSQSSGTMHSSNSQVQGSVKGGMADAQAKGPGSTSSQAQIGFTPFKDNDKAKHDLQKVPFVGGGTASAQSSGRTGQSQSQLHGTFRYGITYSGAAQSGASIDKDAVFPNRMSFEKLDVFDDKTKNINVDITETPIETETEKIPDTTPSLPELSIEEQKEEAELTTTEKSFEETVTESEQKFKEHPHSDHHPYETTSLSPTLTDNRRSFHNSYNSNGAEYEYTTDKEETDDYDPDGPFVPDGSEGDPGPDYSNYDEYTRGDSQTHQSLQNPSRKGLEVRQTTGGNTQHILLGSLGKHDAEINQKSSEMPDEKRVYQPGERVPGTGGYTIPIGFTGSVKSVASKDKTYAVGSRDSPSQAQTVTLTPGTGRVRYVGGGRYARPPELRSLDRNRNNDRYVSVSKSVTRALDDRNNVRKQYSHTYYTKSSSCGYFTFTCTMVSGAGGNRKVCKPKIPTNADGTPIRC